MNALLTELTSSSSSKQGDSPRSIGVDYQFCCANMVTIVCGPLVCPYRMKGGFCACPDNNIVPALIRIVMMIAVLFVRSQWNVGSSH
ncbi:hypothetical protein ElyMa_003461000 [Elysia marginata]|uniref:Uncharacterized protein n=1 Tax=Elysia marginata TaxID=1093978 RepID=A0AAV4E9A2_9GAST|nr:hypothetical protein ElyMa_003461000 [Elysia marginata]